MKYNLENKNKEIFNLIKRNKLGISITELVNNSSASRSSIRIALAYLLGQRKINFKQTGMAKVYYTK